MSTSIAKKIWWIPNVSGGGGGGSDWILFIITTVINKTMYIACVYNSSATKWDVIGVREQVWKNLFYGG